MYTAGQDSRDRFSGALEAYARRNGSGSGAVQADRSRPRTSENVLASSKDTTTPVSHLNFFLYQNLVINALEILLKTIKLFLG